VADAHQAVAVADDHQRGEAEAPTTLDHLGDAVDRHQALDVRGLVLGRPATAPVAAVPAVAVVAAATPGAPAVTPCTSRHQAFPSVFSLLWYIRTRGRPRGRRRRARRPG